MTRKTVRSHSAKALRSLIGNFVIQNLRVPRTNKNGDIIIYKHDVNYQAGKRRIVHHQGDVRLRKLHFLHDLTDWFTVGKNRIEPNSRYINTIRRDEARKASEQDSDNQQNQDQNPAEPDYQQNTNPFGNDSDDDDIN